MCLYILQCTAQTPELFSQIQQGWFGIARFGCLDFICVRPPIGVPQALCIRVVRPSVSAWTCPGVRPEKVLSTISYWTEFHKTVVSDVVEATDELSRFESRGLNIMFTTRSYAQNFGTPYLLKGLKDHNQI